MAGITLTFDLRDEDASGRLARLISNMDNRLPFFSRVGDRLMLSIAENFRSETAPDGTPWAPHRPSTIRSRIRRGQVPLQILSSNTRIGTSLRGSINRQVSNDELRIGSPAEYAAIHQLGGTISKPAGSRWMSGRRFAKRSGSPEGREVAIPAHTISIPARPFIGISNADREGIVEDAEDWLLS